MRTTSSGSMMRTPFDAVDDDDFVFGDEFAGVVQADDGRDVEAAAQDGGVAGRAAGIGYEGGNVLLFE